MLKTERDFLKYGLISDEAARLPKPRRFELISFKILIEITEKIHSKKYYWERKRNLKENWRRKKGLIGIIEEIGANGGNGPQIICESCEF